VSGILTPYTTYTYTLTYVSQDNSTQYLVVDTRSIQTFDDVDAWALYTALNAQFDTLVNITRADHTETTYNSDLVGQTFS
jgi:hypothetical protein